MATKVSRDYVKDKGKICLCSRRICVEDYITDIKVLTILPTNFINVYFRTNKDLLPGICGNGRYRKKDLQI